MKLRPLSVLEQKRFNGEEQEHVEEDVPVKGPTDKSKIKWKKFHTGLEYSKNLLVNSKHILKLHDQDAVVGLVTDDHIQGDDVVCDEMSHKEREKIFSMGFIPHISDEESGTSMEDASSDEDAPPPKKRHSKKRHSKKRHSKKRHSKKEVPADESTSSEDSEEDEVEESKEVHLGKKGNWRRQSSDHDFMLKMLEKSPPTMDQPLEKQSKETIPKKIRHVTVVTDDDE
ncbi:hypothetical protein BGZ81_004608 [Podila clonocystis]|nr:hypothetical protein BGZ81_004608 [Podila clonocystis]